MTRADGLKNRFDSDIRGLMEWWRQKLEETGFAVDVSPECWGDEEWMWDMAVQPPDGSLLVGVTVTLAESAARDGTDEGYNWMVEAVVNDGLIVGTFSPYNFTPDVWTDDDDELNRRFEMVSECDLPQAIIEWYERQEERF